MKEFSFLIVAGGGGSRIGGQEKQFRLLGGKPLWRWSADLANSLCGAGIGEIVLVFPGEHAKELQETKEIRDPAEGVLPLRVAVGGKTRADSVRSGLEHCSRDYVMVHDAARPFATPKLLLSLMEATSETAGAIPVMPLAEAVKKIDGSGQVHAVERDCLYGTQTPQSFPRVPLAHALREHGIAVKDEAEAWLAAGMELRCVDGERMNFKITWPEDLRLASALVSEALMKTQETRTGIGYDVHRLVPERPLILGGVKIDSPLGLLGHSDADVAAHTVADAILGAAGEPDIGNLFPASDEKYKNADSMELLREAVERVWAQGWDIVWTDVVIEAQIPRLNGYIAEMRERLSSVLNPRGEVCVSLKAKSAESTGDVGLGKCVVCRAVATLRREAP